MLQEADTGIIFYLPQDAFTNWRAFDFCYTISSVFCLAVCYWKSARSQSDLDF